MALLGDTNYAGHPLSNHLTLPIDESHFRRWLHLFLQTLTEHFASPIAAEAMKKANLIARTFLARITAFQTGDSLDLLRPSAQT